MLGDGCVALAVVEVPCLVVELGFDDELGELARFVLVAVEDEEEVVHPHDELGELALVLVVVDVEEHLLAPCGEEDVEPHAQWAALLLLDLEEARHDHHGADVGDHVDDDALEDLRVLHVAGDLVRPLRMLHLLLTTSLGSHQGRFEARHAFWVWHLWPGSRGSTFGVLRVNADFGRG